MQRSGSAVSDVGGDCEHRIMQPFTKSGLFWRANAPDRPVPGELVLDGDGLRLTSFQPLSDPLGAGQIARGGPHRATYDRLYAQFFDGQEATLLGVAGFVNRSSSVRDSERFDVEAVLVGGHTNAASYSAVHIRFDVLNGWANPEPLTREIEDGRTVLTVDPTTLAEVRWRAWTIRLRAYPEGRWGPDVHLDQRVHMEIEGPPTGLRELIDGPARALQDLFIVMVGDPVVITDIFVRPDDPGWTERLLRTYFHARQPEPSQRVSPARFRNWDSRTLVVLDDDEVTFVDLVPAWLDLYEPLGYGVQLLCAPMYAPFMYIDSRYTFVFQAVERIAKHRFGGQELPASEHNARVAAVIGALTAQEISAEYIDWARARLQSSNFKKLTTLLTELFEATGKVGAALLGARADVGRTFTGVRGPAAHGARGGRTVEERYWLERALTWVARVDLLHAAGAPLDVLDQRVTRKPEFIQAIRMVRQL
jgi:hypothetical protein